MRFVGFLLGMLFSFNAYSQIYDLVRTISNASGKIERSDASYFTETGTMEINGSTVTRKNTLCITDKPCSSSTYVDQIIGASDTNALLAGDSGDFVTIDILSLSPRLIIYYHTGNLFSIDEYKLRQ